MMVTAMNETRLRAALDAVLSRRLGRELHVAHLERRPFAYQTSSAIDTLDLELGDGARLNLLMKDVSRAGLQCRTSRAKPDSLHNPLREIEVYHQILAADCAGTAVCYGTIIDADEDRYWLLLEHVGGRELYQVGERPLWQAAARWLARLHSQWAGRDAEIRNRAPVLEYDARYYRMWLKRATEFQTRQRALPSSGWQRLMEGYEHVIERLTALPKTFLHGEFYASNVLVGSVGNALGGVSHESVIRGTPQTAFPTNVYDYVRVCPVDWEMAANGPGLIDVAALTAGKWSDQERTALLDTYRSGLEDGGASQGSLQDLQRDLDFCRLHVAVQWLGWSPDWTPPAEHAHNWLGEALHLIEKLEI